jgi:hypothetical protein
MDRCSSEADWLAHSAVTAAAIAALARCEAAALEFGARLANHVIEARERAEYGLDGVLARVHFADDAERGLGYGDGIVAVSVVVEETVQFEIRVLVHGVLPVQCDVATGGDSRFAGQLEKKYIGFRQSCNGFPRP